MQANHCALNDTVTIQDKVGIILASHTNICKLETLLQALEEELSFLFLQRFVHDVGCLEMKKTAAVRLNSRQLILWCWQVLKFREKTTNHHLCLILDPGQLLQKVKIKKNIPTLRKK